MSDTDSEREVIQRTFAADLSAGDGRTVDVRIVPYGEQIEHNDGLGGLPKGMPYREEWSAGCFAGQERAAHRVLANVEHEEGIGGIVGHGLALIERADGLYGSFKIHENADGDKALMLIREGVYDTVSLEAVPLKTVKSRDGIVRRVKAHLDKIAFARYGAYKGAQVLAVRERAVFETEDAIPEEFKPKDMDPAVVERCRRLGISLPERYSAHPDETDTPTDVGTSENGTRHHTDKPNTEENHAADTERATAQP